MIVDYLEKTRTLYLEATQGLTVAQWRFQPAPEIWSVADCAEHVAVVENHVFAMVRNMATGPEASPEELTQVKGKAELILKLVPSRRQKALSPEKLLPANRWAKPEDLIAHFVETRDRIIAFARSMDGGLRNRIAPHFVLGPLSGEQWLLFIAAHSERHVTQIGEVKTHSGYPS